MKKFQIFRYLKTYRFLIVLIALLGSLAVYAYVSSNQQYTAQIVIEYTNPGAEKGLTPSGVPIDVSEIYSASVITDVIAELGLSANVEFIRSSCTVSEIIPSEEATRRDALLADGQEWVYFPTKYSVSYVAGNSYGRDYARDVLDSIISNYYTFYSKKYVDYTLIPNNASNINIEKYDFYDCVEMLDSTANEIKSYIENKSNQYPNFRSSITGYSFGDLLDDYSYISDNIVPKLYAVVMNEKLVIDKVSLVERYREKINQNNIYIESLTAQIDSLRELIEKYSGKTLEGYGGTYTIQDGQALVGDGIDYQQNSTTTYDRLVNSYVSLQSERLGYQTSNEKYQEVINCFEDGANINPISNADAKKAANDIQSTVEQLNNLYEILVPTVDELNEKAGADNLSSLTSIAVSENININTYIAVAVALFLAVGCVGAVLLGRLGDIIEYFLYTDRKNGLPNRAKCDLVIEEYESGVLDEHFSCLVIRLNRLESINSRLGRSAGDSILRSFSKILTAAALDYGFIGYNEGNQYIAFFEHCSKMRTENFIAQVRSRVDAFNSGRVDASIEFTTGLAESTADNVYAIRDLLRLAFKRLNS